MSYVGGDDAAFDGCLLCAIDSGAAPGPNHVVERAELTYTLLNRYPYSSGHVMVVPRRHSQDIADLTDAESLALLAAARRVMQALESEMAPEGFNLGINQGAAAGASLPHLHLHVVPRWAGDTNFMPVLGDVKVLPEHLEATAERLRSRLASSAAE